MVFVAHWRVAVPTLTRLAVLWDEAIGTLQFHAIETAARSSGVTLESFPIRTAEEINDVVERAAQRRVDGMIVLTSPLIFNQRSQIADLALKARLPTINGFNLYPKTGGLMAYGPNFPSMFKQAASCVDRILSGANPGELPIERPTKFELVINIKTAKALGLKVPCRSLAMAVRQMLHQRPHVGERCKLHDLGNNESDAASVAPNPHAYATPTAFYERKTSNPMYTSAYASRMKLISLMHGPAGGECLPLKSRGKSLTLNLLTVC